MAPLSSRPSRTICSWRSPPVSTAMIGLPPPSARRCSLVENPPCERPRDSSGASPPDGAGPAGAGGVLMSPNNGGIHKVQVPFDLPTGIRLDLQSRQDALPQAGLAPAIEATG